MITMSILWALIICLFIMNSESPNNHRIGSLVRCSAEISTITGTPNKETIK